MWWVPLRKMVLLFKFNKVFLLPAFLLGVCPLLPRLQCLFRSEESVT